MVDQTADQMAALKVEQMGDLWADQWALQTAGRMADRTVEATVALLAVR
jgi:hypothetical protein